MSIPISRHNKNKRFLINEFIFFSVNAGFQTRNEDFPIYDIENRNLHDVRFLKRDIYEFLWNEFVNNQSNRMYDEKEHIKKIVQLKKTLESKYSKVLFQEKFRVGVSQKVINLFFKYLWSAGLMNEPVHCPIDNIVKQRVENIFKNAELQYWTEFDDLESYKKYIFYLKKIAESENKSIAKWEMNFWNRRT